MILDFSKNWKCYAKENSVVWKTAFDFIASVNQDTELGKYTIQDEDFHAFVQGYDTIPQEVGKIEIHYDFIDIHAVISGGESVYYSPVNSLELIEDFRPGSDDLLYKFKPEIATSFELRPGQFAMFLPEEGHMTRIQIAGNSERVKKVVIKVAKYLIF